MGNNAEAPRTSGIQVLDRAVHILTAIADQPRTLTQLCEATQLPRATAHRIAVALEKHRLIARQPDGSWTSGPALADLTPSSRSRLELAAETYLPGLMAAVGESVQIYRIIGDERICIANAEPTTGLRDTVPVGHRMSLRAGSAAKVLVAYAPAPFQQAVLQQAAYTQEDLKRVAKEGIAESRAERDPSLASASVPLFDSRGAMIAALSVSGPVDRMGLHPAAQYGEALRETAARISEHIG
ncbi:IclR family transcriptional regulator [Corynebacterium heidelbergense]|uniref:IclR family transcriptional regulator n=1 Tax=Corynebacterium heidelbergense TaxID=2055947 RepID=A0A364V400_9CORY|nr:IclR family transcriptional regulator [Corynebacterium heidelbergense]RAV31364.1 IclR family transcriptional regulator [Corynebacterium heidelbergense]